MRRHRPQPKERRHIDVPDELRDSMHEVYELIQEAERDPDIEIGYGDAIQVGSVCGGRIGKKLRPYVFTYYPTGDDRRGRWYLSLYETEIEDLGDGRMAQISMYCCTSSECRTKFRAEGESCFYCDYFEDDPAVVEFERRFLEIAATSNSKMEFVAAYVKLKPNASGSSLIGDYNPIDGLGERLGWFSGPEADDLIRQAKENG